MRTLSHWIPTLPRGMSMNDAENLSKLLNHLPPAVFRDGMEEVFGLALPELDPKQIKRAQRARLEAGLAALTVPARRKIEEAVEPIVLLSDGPGQDVMEGFRHDLFDAAERAAFEGLCNQYERALWLYLHAPALFREALEARQADVFRQSAACYSGFVVPKRLKVQENPILRQAFHENVARHFGCSTESVAIQIFKRLRPDPHTGEEIDLYQINLHHNRPPEIMDGVEASEVAVVFKKDVVFFSFEFEVIPGFS